MDKDTKHSKGGFTVSELETHFKKHGHEITLCAVFVLTAIFTLVWGGAMMTWSVILCMLCAIVGVFTSKHIHKGVHSGARFVRKDKASAITGMVVSILLSIFLPIVIFAIVGAIAGHALHPSCCGACAECGSENCTCKRNKSMNE